MKSPETIARLRAANPEGYDAEFKRGVADAERCRAERVGYYADADDASPFDYPVLDAMSEALDKRLRAIAPFGTREYGSAGWGYQNGFQSVLDADGVDS